MVNQRHCPFCGVPAKQGCAHLALAVPGRDFVHCCVEASHARRQWQALCLHVRDDNARLGNGSMDREDFTWLETAFCDRFLRGLRWFGGMDHEWRTGPKLEQGGFYVLLWSRCPEKLWWELADNIDRQLIDIQALPVGMCASRFGTQGMFPSSHRNTWL
jgi:hypothetical protein